MSDRVRLDWLLSADVYEQFQQTIRDEHGELDGYTGRAVARAMREYVDADDYAALEGKIDRLVQAAGRLPSAREEKNLAQDTTGETTRICARVDAELKERFKRFVDEHTDLAYGQALARALRTYLDGGRAARLERKLDRVVDDAEAVLSEVNGDGDLTQRERKTIAVCKELGDQFTREDLEETIREVAGVDSEPSIRTYSERVLDRLDVVEHPNATDLFVPEEYARKLAVTTRAPSPDAPAVDRKDFADLDREEKVHGVRLELARKAARRDGIARFSVSDLRDRFGYGPSNGHLTSLLQAAGEAEGYTSRKKRGDRVLDVELRPVTDEEILHDPKILAHVEGVDSDDVQAGDGPPDEPDASPTGSTTDSTPAVATDGGRDEPDDEADPGGQRSPLDADDPDRTCSRLDALAAATPSNAD